MPQKPHIEFIENPGLNGSREHYMTVTLDVPRVLESWRHSLFSFEWLDKDGGIKGLDQLSESEKPKRLQAEEKLKTRAPFEQPVLGIGIGDNVEIGMGRADFLTLAAHGIKAIPVHIPRSSESDFKPFRADVQ